MSNRKKNVAMLLFGPYPVDDRVYREAKSLIATNAFDVTIFAWKKTTDSTYEVIEKINIIRLNTNAQTHIKSVKQLFIFNMLLFLLLMKMPPFSIYHAHDFTTLPTAYVVGRLKRAKVVYDAHEYYPSLLASDKIVPWPFIIMVIILEKHLSNLVDLVMTVTHSQTKLFARRYKIRDIVVIFNAPTISQERVEKLLSEEEALRKKWGISKSNFVIAYPGAINPGRCLEQLIEAIPSLDNMKTIKVIIIGPSSTEIGYRAKLKNLVNSLGIQNNVHIFNEISREEIAEIFSICDLIYAIYPKIRDYPIAIPGKVLKAVRFKKMFVTSNFGEMKALAEKFPLGVAVDPYSIRDITTALKDAMSKQLISFDINIIEYEELWWKQQELKLQKSFISLFKN